MTIKLMSPLVAQRQAQGLDLQVQAGAQSEMAQPTLNRKAGGRSSRLRNA